MNPKLRVDVSLVPRVRAIQALLGVKPDGIIGPNTLRAIERAIQAQQLTEKQPDDSTDEVRYDERSEKNLSTLDPKAQPILRKLTAIAKDEAIKAGLDIQVISGNRTWEEQDELYKRGRSKAGSVVTNAKGGQSNHNFGIAVDFGVFGDDGKYYDGGSVHQRKAASDLYKEISNRCKQDGLSIEWGGDWNSFKDYPHFEVPTGLTMSQKRERYKQFGSVL